MKGESSYASAAPVSGQGRPIQAIPEGGLPAGVCERKGPSRPSPRNAAGISPIPIHQTCHSPNREPNSTGVRRRRNFVSICIFVFRPLPVVNTFIALGVPNGQSLARKPYHFRATRLQGYTLSWRGWNSKCPSSQSRYETSSYEVHSRI
jgi:hypothetical protein